MIPGNNDTSYPPPQQYAMQAQRYGILPINSDGIPDFDNLIYSHNVDDHSYPASTTKVLTALTALDHVSLQTSVTIIQSDLVAGSGHNLQDGDVISVQDLIINMMLPSSNIAAMALARVAGSAAGEDFISLMNKKAASLGMTSSRFINPTGLPNSRQLTTARDLMRLGVAASKHPEFNHLWNLKNATLTVTGSNARSIEVESSFIDVKDRAWCIGGKSGSITGWGYNLFCHVILQNGYTGIAVILKTSSKNQRDIEMISMVECAKLL